MAREVLLLLLAAGAQFAAGQAPVCPKWGAAGQGVTEADRPAVEPSVFTELSEAELKQVQAFLGEKLGTEPIAYDSRALYRNFIHGAWLEVPPKGEVLAHLDRGGPKPVRKARAVVVMGAASPPYVQEVLVWPLPGPQQWAPAKINTTAERLPFDMRPHSGADIPGQVYLLSGLAKTLAPLLRGAFGAGYGEGCEPECVYDNYANIGYLSPEIPRALWLWFVKPMQSSGDGNFLHPVPLQVAIAQNGQDISNWRIVKVWFWGSFFDSAEQLAAEYAKPDSRLRTLKMKFPTGDERLFSNFKRRPGAVRGANQPLGPIAFEPYGRRFSIEGNRVSWLGWEFYVGNKPTAGARLWDIRFKGERIVYELSLQEEMAAYGGDDIVQSHTVFLDSHWGVGASVRELVHGVDCPLTAAYMDATTLYKSMGAPVVHKNAVCVFESDQNIAALRHYDYAFQFYGAVKSHVLTVRMVAEVYNYDYVVDFKFYVDGTLEPSVSTSGYIQAAGGFLPYWRNKFAYPVMYNVSGSIHNHLIAWKADLDINGTANSVNMHTIGIQKTTIPGMGMPIWNHRYDAQMCEREDDTAVKFSAAQPKYPVIVSERGPGNKNKWGSLRGYRVMPTRVMHNLIPEEGWGGGLGFANWGFVATVRKELEPDSSSIYSQANLAAAPVRLQTFIDGEGARGKDLVAWISSGLYHIPVSEDAPVTPTVYNHLGFMLVPFNFHDENAATDMADLFQIDDSNAQAPPVQEYVSDARYQCSPQFDSVPFSRVWDPN